MLGDPSNTRLSPSEYKKFQRWCRVITTLRLRNKTTIKKKRGLFLDAFMAGETPEEFYNKHQIVNMKVYQY